MFKFNDDIIILSSKASRTQCKRWGLSAKPVDIKKSLLLDKNIICIDDEAKNIGIKKVIELNAYHSGTELLIDVRQSIENSASLIGSQRILHRKDERNFSLDQIEQVKHKTQQEIKNPLKTTELETKDDRLEKNIIDQLTTNRYLTNDDINLLSYKNYQTECDRRGISANKKSVNILKRIALDNEAIRIDDKDENNKIKETPTKFNYKYLRMLPEPEKGNEKTSNSKNNWPTTALYHGANMIKNPYHFVSIFSRVNIPTTNNPRMNDVQDYLTADLLINTKTKSEPINTILNRMCLNLFWNINRHISNYRCTTKRTRRLRAIMNIPH